MFRLGVYDEDEARIVADYLREAGMKVELKPFIEGQVESQDVLEGRMSEIKEEIKDAEAYERYDRYLNALREIMPQTSGRDELLEALVQRLDPAVDEKRAEIEEILKARREGHISDEESEANKKRFSELIHEMVEIANAQIFAKILVERNKIEVGGYIGNRLDDPIVRIPVDLEDYDDESRFARTSTLLTLVPMMEVNIDELSAALAEDLDEDFRDDYPDESLMITGLSALMVKLVEKAPKEKMEMDDFAEICDMDIENEGNILHVKGYDAADELAKALEKNGVIKRKGDIIKWRR